MSHSTYTKEEVARQGELLYEQQIRSRLRPEDHGKFLVVDVTTGDYEIAEDDLTASDRAMAKNPQAVLYGLRIGSKAAYRLGMRFIKGPS